MKTSEIKSAIARRLNESELKTKERVIVGKLLIDFFELERNLNYLLAECLLDPGDKRSLDTILDNTPLRHRIEAAKEYSLLSMSEAKLFHQLCDERNKLAHVPSKKKRIFDLFPHEVQELFIKRCAELNTVISDKRFDMLAKWL